MSLLYNYTVDQLLSLRPKVEEKSVPDECTKKELSGDPCKRLGYSIEEKKEMEMLTNQGIRKRNPTVITPGM